MTATATSCTATPAVLGHNGYERYRRRQIAYGRWQPYPDADTETRLREHLRELRRAGMGRCRIASLSGLNESVVYDAFRGRRVTTATALRLLQVPFDPRVVDATGSRRRAQALYAIGWDQKWQAGQVGWRFNNYYLIVHGKRAAVNRATAAAITDLYIAYRDQPAPPGPAATRARNTAARYGWLGPDWWEAGDDIDEPEPEPEPGFIDPVAVERACSGDKTVLPYLSDAERLTVAVCLTEQGWGAARIAGVLNISERRVRALREQHAATSN
jgi:hypothetical protein